MSFYIQDPVLGAAIHDPRQSEQVGVFFLLPLIPLAASAAGKGAVKAALKNKRRMAKQATKTAKAQAKTEKKAAKVSASTAPPVKGVVIGNLSDLV